MPSIVSTMIQLHVHREVSPGVHEYLILQRSADEAVYPGLWQVVTGSIDEGESSSDAAQREMCEETGLKSERIIALPYVASFYLADQDSIHLVPVFSAEAPRKAEVRLSSEHQAFVWMPYEEAYRRLVFPSHKEGHRVLRDFVLLPLSSKPDLPGASPVPTGP